MCGVLWERPGSRCRKDGRVVGAEGRSRDRATQANGSRQAESCRGVRAGRWPRPGYRRGASLEPGSLHRKGEGCPSKGSGAARRQENAQGACVFGVRRAEPGPSSASGWQCCCGVCVSAPAFVSANIRPALLTNTEAQTSPFTTGSTAPSLPETERQG